MAHTDGIRAFRLSMNALKLLEKVKRRETETMFISFLIFRLESKWKRNYFGVLTLDYRRPERVGCWGNENICNAQSLCPLPNGRHVKKSFQQQHILLIRKELAVQDRLSGKGARADLLFFFVKDWKDLKVTSMKWRVNEVKNFQWLWQLYTLSSFHCWRYGTVGSSPGTLRWGLKKTWCHKT